MTPRVAIIFDRSLQHDHPRSKLAPFWVRVQETENYVRFVEIDAWSLPQAVRNAVKVGLVPTKWSDGGPMWDIPSGLHHMLPN